MKIANTTLLNSILSSVWMIDTEFANNMAPLVIELMQGNKVEFPTQENNDYLIAPTSGRLVNATWGVDQDIESGSIAVVSIKGAITRYTQWCGPRGTKQLNSLVKDLDQNPKISAIIFDIDTPGGEANFLNTFANTIRETSKPTIGTYSGLCCSAGYYLGSAMDELYAQEKMDVVGSIGTMVSIADYSKWYKKAGIKIHDIYAQQSTEKNQDYYEALKGNYGPIQKILDEYATDFIEAVKVGRPDVSEKVFKGRTYTSNRAERLGLIDGVKTFDEVIERANELVATNEDNNSGDTQYNNKTMKLENIANALGFESTEIEAQDGFISLSVENAEKLEAALNTPEAVIEETEEEGLVDRVEALETRLEAAEGKVAKNEKNIKTIGAGTGTPVSTTPKENDDTPEVESWNDPNNPNNKSVEADLAE